MKISIKGSLTSALAAAALLMAGAATATAADIAIIGGKADDPFFAKIKRGIDDATMVVEAHGGSVNFLTMQSYEQIGPDAASLIRTAISQGVDGIAAPNWVPEAQDEAYRAAVDAGITVLLYNSGGYAKAEELGSDTYIGTNERKAGLAGGAYLAEQGFQNVICVNTVPGAANLEARCQGIADGLAEGGGGTSTQLPLPAANFGDPTAVAEAIKATLLQDDSIEAIVTVGAQSATAAATALMQIGLTGKVKLGQFDMDGPTLDRIKEGSQMFAIDQQPYLQGFLAVFLLNTYLDYALAPASRPILTGPAIIDASNVDAALAGVAAGVR